MGSCPIIGVNSVAVWDMGNWGRLFQILVAAPKWITWLAWTNKIRILNEAKLETRVIAIGETLGGMWSVSRSRLGHPARRDWGQGELAESPHTKRHRCNSYTKYEHDPWKIVGCRGVTNRDNISVHSSNLKASENPTKRTNRHFNQNSSCSY